MRLPVLTDLPLRSVRYFLSFVSFAPSFLPSHLPPTLKTTYPNRCLRVFIHAVQLGMTTMTPAAAAAAAAFRDHGCAVAALLLGVVVWMRAHMYRE